MKYSTIFILILVIGAVLLAGCTSSRSTPAVEPTVQATVKATSAPVSSNPRWGDFELQPGLHWEKNEYGNRFVVGTVKNTGTKTYSYAQVSINLYDSSGAQVGSALDNLNNLEPGGLWKFRAIVIEDTAENAKVKEISGW